MTRLSPVAPGRPKKFCETDALSRAMDVFWDHGYEATSMAQLVEAMCIGRQSLYDTFGDKRQLFIAALNHYSENRLQGVLNQLDGPEPPLDRIRNLFSQLEEHNTTCSRGCLLANTMNELGDHDAEVSQIQCRLVDRLTGKLAEVLGQAKEQGALVWPDPDALARTLVTMVQGMSLMGKGGVDPSYIRSTVQTAHHLLERQ